MEIGDINKWTASSRNAGGTASVRVVTNNADQLFEIRTFEM